MLKYYYNTNSKRIGQYNGVSDSVLSTSLDVPNKYIELSEEQVARIGNGSITYIITGNRNTKDFKSKSKAKASQDLHTAYQTALSAGFEYDGNTFNLDENTKQNIGDWTSFLVLEPELNEFKITDNSFNQITMNKSEFTAFGVGFGIALSTIKAKYANYRNILATAETIEEVEELTFTF